MSWSAIAQLESGRRRDVRLATAAALAAALGVTVEYLDTGLVSVEGMLRHRLLEFGSAEGFSSTVGPFLREGIERSETLLVVVEGAKADLLREGLGSSSGSVGWADRKDWYSSGAKALQAYLTFLEESTSDSSPWIRIVGEPVGAAAWTRDPEALARYEATADLAFAPFPATILCVYELVGDGDGLIDAARTTHPERADGDLVTRNPSYRSPNETLLGEVE